MVPCLEGAIARAEPWGVWGGQLLLNGKVLAVKRRRGRPRKHPRLRRRGAHAAGTGAPERLRPQRLSGQDTRPRQTGRGNDQRAPACRSGR